MTRNRTLAIALALTIGLLTSGTALARSANCGDCPGHQSAAGRGKGAEMGTMSIPNLTTEQKDKIDGLREGHVKEIGGLRTDLEVKKIELSRLWQTDKLDGNKLVAKVKEISELRGKLQLARVNHHLAVYKLLTPEQQKEFRPPMLGRDKGQGKGAGRGMGKAGAGRGKAGGGDCGDCGGH